MALVDEESIYLVFLSQALFSLAVENILFNIINTVSFASSTSRVYSLSI